MKPNIYTPARKTITRSHKGFRSKVPSKKMKMTVMCESLLEAQFARLVEVHPMVAEYYYQPTEEWYYDDLGNRLTCFPDFKVVWRNGSWTYFEVKPDAKLKCPDLRAKLELISKNFEARSINYRVITDKELEEPVRGEILKGLHKINRLSIPPARLSQILSHEDLSKSRTLGNLTKLFGEADALKLVAGGHFFVLFDARLDQGSRVYHQLEEVQNHDSFRI